MSKTSLFSFYSKPPVLLDPYYGVVFKNSSTNQEYWVQGRFVFNSLAWKLSEEGYVTPLPFGDEYPENFSLTIPQGSYEGYVVFNMKSIREFLNYWNYRCYFYNPNDIGGDLRPDLSCEYQVINNLGLMYDDFLYGDIDEMKNPVEPPKLKADLEALPDLVESSLGTFEPLDGERIVFDTYLSSYIGDWQDNFFYYCAVRYEIDVNLTKLNGS